MFVFFQANVPKSFKLPSCDSSAMLCASSLGGVRFYPLEIDGNPTLKQDKPIKIVESSYFADFPENSGLVPAREVLYVNVMLNDVLNALEYRRI